MHQLEFTIEPFVEGRPGRHVTAAIEALEALGAIVDVGPFGSSCTATADRLPELVAAVTQAALANGATHVTLDIGAVTDGPEGAP